MVTSTDTPTKLSIAMRFDEWGQHGRVTRQRTLRNVAGVWVVSTNQPHLSALCGNPTGRKRFEEDSQEVVSYAAQVAADMLNAGDMEPIAEHVRVVREAIQPCGHALRLNGAWWGNQLLDIPERYGLIAVSAWLRCGRYLAQEMAAGTSPSGAEHWQQSAVTEWWWPHRRIAPYLLLWQVDPENERQREEAQVRRWNAVARDIEKARWDGYYMGRDNRLLHRIAELDVDGLTIFDIDYRSPRVPETAKAVALYLRDDPGTSEELRARAEFYLQTEDQLRHWHCDVKNCKSKHSKPTVRCSGIRREDVYNRSDYPCKEGYPCLHDDSAAFSKRFM